MTGPVEYRKGVLLLKSNNVHFLGGEVEHLLIKNAPLNMLCRALLVYNLIYFIHLLNSNSNLIGKNRN